MHHRASESMEYKMEGEDRVDREPGIGPVAQFAHSFSRQYTARTCSKSKFYLRTMRGRVPSTRRVMSGGIGGGRGRERVGVGGVNIASDADMKRISNTRAPPPHPFLSEPSQRYLHRLKSNSTATMLKDFFLYVASLPYAERNKRQCKPLLRSLCARACTVACVGV